MAMAAWSEKANLLICERRRFASPVSSKRKERHCWRSRCVVRYVAVGCDAVRCVSPASPIQRLERQAQRYLGQFAWRTLSLRLDQVCISAGPNRARIRRRPQDVVEKIVEKAVDQRAGNGQQPRAWQLIPSYRSGVSPALKTRFTRDRDILNVRAMAAGFMPALNDARMRFALPSGISSISLIVLLRNAAVWPCDEVPVAAGTAGSLLRVPRLRSTSTVIACSSF